MNHATHSAADVQSAFLTLHSIDLDSLSGPAGSIAVEDVRSLTTHLQGLLDQVDAAEGDAAPVPAPRLPAVTCNRKGCNSHRRGVHQPAPNGSILHEQWKQSHGVMNAQGVLVDRWWIGIAAHDGDDWRVLLRVGDREVWLTDEQARWLSQGASDGMAAAFEGRWRDAQAAFDGASDALLGLGREQVAPAGGES